MCRQLLNPNWPQILAIFEKVSKSYIFHGKVFLGNFLQTLNDFLLKPIGHSDLVPRSVWPDLAKFQHFGKTLKNFCHFERVELVFGKILSLLVHILYAIGQILMLELAKYSLNNPAIWSQWPQCSLKGAFTQSVLCGIIRRRLGYVINKKYFFH